MNTHARASVVSFVCEIEQCSCVFRRSVLFSISTRARRLAAMEEMLKTLKSLQDGVAELKRDAGRV